MVEAAKKSFGRSLNHGDLISRFYDILLAAHPDIPEKFSNTDMNKQKELLVHGINLALMYAEGNAIGENGLIRLRESHNRHNLDIRPELYQLWIDSFIQALSETDPDFNEEIKQDWLAVANKTTDFLAEGY